MTQRLITLPCHAQLANLVLDTNDKKHFIYGTENNLSGTTHGMV